MTNQDNKNGLETKIVKGPATGDTTQEQENKPKVKLKVAKPKAATTKTKGAAEDGASGEKQVRSGRKLPGRPVKKSAARPSADHAKSKKEVEEAQKFAEKETTKTAEKAVEKEPTAVTKEDKTPKSKGKEEATETAASKASNAEKMPAVNTEHKTDTEDKKEQKTSAEEAVDKEIEPAAKKEEKKPTKKKKNPEMPVRRQEIKIVKSVEQQKKEKEERDKKCAAKKAEEEKATKKTETRRPRPSQGAASQDSSPKNDRKSGGRRNDRKSKGHEEHDKFSKLEKKRATKELQSLEKKERKKHQKPKAEPKPEPVEELVPAGTVVVNVPITIAGFSEQVGVSVSQVIMTLLKMGVIANQNQSIDETTVEMLAEELNLQVVIGRVEEEEVQEEGLDLSEDREKDLEARPPIITVMGHVDHGKTSLLDAIRKTNVISTESGGITQHIGASEVEINGQKIVFLDTPGHEAFTAMRARGANITDIAVLVVAADDSVKPQTIESISHAKAADVPIIVAINKMDKPGANPDIVKKDLADHGVLVEEWGGTTIAVPVSAKKGEGLTDLLEMIILQSEMLELKANPNRLAMGTVLEARLDKSKGPVTSLLVTNGTLKAGQSIVAGTSYGKIRKMTNSHGEPIRKAGPATAVEILGLTEVPAAGDSFNAASKDRQAREIAENRKEKQREEVMAKTSSTTLEELFSSMQEGEIKELNLLVKADVRGSVGAIITSLEKLSNENVKVNIIHSGVGAINDSDVTLANTSGAIIIGFNVRPTAAVTSLADRENVQIRTYSVIYNIIDDVENAMKGLLDPEFKEEVLGQCQVRDTFKVPGVGIIAGGYVTNGKIARNANIRLVRDGIVIHEGIISSLKRFKDDAKEVAQGYECGIGIENYNDLKENDVIECFHMVEVERK